MDKIMGTPSPKGSGRRFIVAAALVTAGLWAGAAQAGGVNWSIGINLPPIGAVISDGPSYGYGGYGAPAYGYGAPVYSAPPVYVAPPVVYAPPPVVYRPYYRDVPRYVVPPVAVRPGWNAPREWRGDNRGYREGYREGRWEGGRNDGRWEGRPDGRWNNNNRGQR